MTDAHDVAEALLTQRVTVLEQQVKALLDDRDRALRWGLTSLGAAVLALGTFIANHLLKEVAK